jgi:hypothetical protein
MGCEGTHHANLTPDTHDVPTGLAVVAMFCAPPRGPTLTDRVPRLEQQLIARVVEGLALAWLGDGRVHEHLGNMDSHFSSNVSSFSAMQTPPLDHLSIIPSISM